MQLRYPSVKTIIDRLGLARAEAQELREAMFRNRGLKVANRLLSGFGIETIGLPDGCFNSCQSPDVEIRYVNLGDTYKDTLMRVNGVYKVGNWGSEVEAYERYGINAF
jgi:hypothetical protein